MLELPEGGKEVSDMNRWDEKHPTASRLRFWPAKEFTLRILGL